MLQLLCSLILILSFGFISTIKSMVYDNRYAPEYMSPILFKPRPRMDSNFQAIPIYMRANHSFGDMDSIGYPELNGLYNLADINRGLMAANVIQEDLFRSDLRGLPKVIWNRQGRLDIEALALYYQNILCDNVIVGSSYLFGHVNSRHDFILNKGSDTSIPNIKQGDEEYLYMLRAQVMDKLNVDYAIFRKVISGDLDLFFKFGKQWQYRYRCRSIDAWLTTGAIFPIGNPYEINNPASIILGGNRHWGVYLGVQGHAEVREDWHIDILFRAIKRLPKTFSCARMPGANELFDYGAIVGPMYVNPGYTFAFSGFLILEDFSYDGLGAKLGYTVIGHLEDKLVDKRKDQTIPSNLKAGMELSSWGIEFVRACVFYDFAKKLDYPSSLPSLSLYLDVPVHSTISKRSVKTYAISLAIETNF